MGAIGVAISTFGRLALSVLTSKSIEEKSLMLLSLILTSLEEAETVVCASPLQYPTGLFPNPDPEMVIIPSSSVRGLELDKLCPSLT